MRSSSSLFSLHMKYSEMNSSHMTKGTPRGMRKGMKFGGKKSFLNKTCLSNVHVYLRINGVSYAENQMERKMCCWCDVCKYLSEKCKFIHFSISMMKKCTYLSVTQFFSPFFMRKIPKWFFLSRSFVQFGMSDEKIKYKFRELQATIGVQLHCYISWNKREREKHNV